VKSISIHRQGSTSLLLAGVRASASYSRKYESVTLEVINTLLAIGVTKEICYDSYTCNRRYRSLSC